MKVKTELIVALDMPTTAEALEMVGRLAGVVDFFKVGLELFIAAGPDVINHLKDKGARVFLDLKLHDIPNQTASAVTAAGRLNVDLLTVHTLGGREMMTAAAEAVRGETKLLGVTILTSHSGSGLIEIGMDRMVADRVSRLALLARESGLDGVIASGLEAAEIRNDLGSEFIIVTPGIRASGDDAGDQKRTVTPIEAAVAGANFLVVGRPIITASDPVAAAKAILAVLPPVG